MPRNPVTPAEPFDIGTLIPPGVRRVKLEIRLKEESVGIRVVGAEDRDGAMQAAGGGAVLWRAPGTPVLLSVPPDLALVIDIGSEPGP